MFKPEDIHLKQSGHGLVCPYRVLVAYLGNPRRIDREPQWEVGDKKERARWQKSLVDIGDVEVYDYRAHEEHIPVELVNSWSVKAAPAVKDRLVEELQKVAADEDLNKHCLKMVPRIDHIFQVPFWEQIERDSLPGEFVEPIRVEWPPILQRFADQVDWQAINEIVDPYDEPVVHLGVTAWWGVMRIDFTDKASWVLFFDMDPTSEFRVVAKYVITLDQ